MEYYGRGKLIFAPMVRIGTLPSRLLALRYGADLVYSPETVDKKLERCHRQVDPETGCVDFVCAMAPPPSTHVSLVFRTHPEERSRLVLQLGTADPECAVRAARLVQADVSGIDVNCGCPKRFSTHAGMGAALLRTPDRLCAILEALVAGQPLPVSAKIRILGNHHDDGLGGTLELVERLWRTGISALTVHGRTPSQRYDTRADWEAVRAIRAASPPDRPVILSGDVFSPADYERAVGAVGCDAVMLGRAAQNNLSVFRTIRHRQPPLPLESVSSDYVAVAARLGNPLHNTKYCLIQAWAAVQPKGPPVKDLLRQLYVAKSYFALGRLFGLDISTEQSARLDAASGLDHQEDVESGYSQEQQEARLARQVCSE